MLLWKLVTPRPNVLYGPYNNLVCRVLSDLVPCAAAVTGDAWDCVDGPEPLSTRCCYTVRITRPVLLG